MIGMLEEADTGILFKSSNSIKSKYSQYFSCDTYSDLLKKFIRLLINNKDN